jgi:hypothetical protein
MHRRTGDFIIQRDVRVIVKRVFHLNGFVTGAGEVQGEKRRRERRQRGRGRARRRKRGKTRRGRRKGTAKKRGKRRRGGRTRQWAITLRGARRA